MFISTVFKRWWICEEASNLSPLKVYSFTCSARETSFLYSHLTSPAHTPQNQSLVSCTLRIYNPSPTSGNSLPSPLLTLFPIIHLKPINHAAIFNLLIINGVILVPLDSGRITTLQDLRNRMWFQQYTCGYLPRYWIPIRCR